MRGAHSWTAERMSAWRIELVDAAVADVGAVEALRRFDAAVVAALEQAQAAAKRGHLGAAQGYRAAAAYAQGNARLLVERHA